MVRSILGLVINLDVSGALVSMRQLGVELQGALAQYQSSMAAATAAAASNAGLFSRQFTQSIANSTYGLQHLSGGVRAVSNSMIAGLSEAQEAADSYEASLARVRITMGLSGINADNQALLQEYGVIRREIERIAAETEFDLEQTARTFTYLKQTGRTAMEAIQLTPSIMALSSASGGLIELSEAARIAQLSTTAFNTDIEDIPRNLDMMLRAIQNSPLEFTDLGQMMSSMGGVGALMPDTKMEEFLAIAGVLRQAGRSPAQIGSDFQGVQRFTNFSARAMAGQGGPGMRQRQIALERMGITRSTFESDTVNPVTGLRELRPFPDILMNIIERMNATRREMAQTGEGVMTFNSLLQTIAGRQQVANVLVQIMTAAENGRVSLENLASVIADVNDDAIGAQKVYLSTTEGMRKVFEGVFKSFLVKLAGPWQGAVDRMLGSLNELLMWANKFADENPRLLSVISTTIATFVGLTAILAGVLGVLTFLALTTLVMTTVFGTAGGAALTFGVMMRMLLIRGLLPLGLLIWPLIKGLLVFAALGAVMYVGWRNNVLGIRDILQTLYNDATIIVSNLEKLVSGEGMSLEEWDLLSVKGQEWLRRLVTVAHGVKAFFEGFIPSLMEFSWVAWLAIARVLAPIIWLGKLVLWLGESIGLLSFRENGNEMRTFGDIAGKVVGTILALGVAWWIVAGAMRVVALLRSTVLGTIAAYKGLALFFGILTGTSLTFLGVIGALVSILAVGIAAGGLLFYTEELNQKFKEATGGVIELRNALMIMGMIGAVGIAMTLGPLGGLLAMVVVTIAAVVSLREEISLLYTLMSQQGTWSDIFKELRSHVGLDIMGASGNTRLDAQGNPLESTFFERLLDPRLGDTGTILPTTPRESSGPSSAAEWRTVPLPPPPPSPPPPRMAPGWGGQEWQDLSQRAPTTVHVNVGDLSPTVTSLDEDGARRFAEAIGPQLLRVLDLEGRRNGYSAG